MKKWIVPVVVMTMLLSAAGPTVWASGGKVRGDKASGPAGTTGGGKVQTTRGS